MAIVLSVRSDSDQVYNAIRDMISSGEFQGGQPLREQWLAERVGVSRTPVRDALKRLATEGIVELRPNKGAQLVLLGPEEVNDVFDVRSLLEPYLAGRAATRVDEHQLQIMQQLLVAMEGIVSEGGVQLDELASLNSEFHGLIIDAAKVRPAADALAIAMRPPLVRRTFHRYSSQQLLRSQQHHREILAALRARNSVWAESAMRSHIEAARSISFDVPGPT